MDELLDPLMLSEVLVDVNANLELIIIKLNELVTLSHLIFAFFIATMLTLVIYKMLSKFMM